MPVSPIVPAAILYDLANGGDKNWGTNPPYRDLGFKAVDAASLEPLKSRKFSGRLAAAVFLGKARLIDNIPLPVLP